MHVITELLFKLRVVIFILRSDDITNNNTIAVILTHLVLYTEFIQYTRQLDDSIICYQDFEEF